MASSRINHGVILNDISSETPTPHDLGFGWTLERASQSEVAAFLPTLVAAAAPSTFTPSAGWLGINNQARITPSGGGHLFEPFPDAADWRFFVVRPRGEEALAGYKLAEALRLSSNDLFLETWSVQAQIDDQLVSRIGGNPGQCAQFYSRYLRQPLPQIPDLDKVVETVALRANLQDDRFAEISRSVELFRELDVVPEHSNAKLLGYFGVIESLLSHSPEPTDTYDSITRQLKRNFTLIENRLPGGHSFGLDLFGGAKPDTLIAKLYKYRSLVAHGGDGASVLAWLNDNRPSQFNGWPGKIWLHQYIRNVTKEALLAALREPQLITDIK